MGSVENLLSGLVGALIGAYVPICQGRYRDLYRYKSLLIGLSAECKQNIGNLNEMIEGVLKRGKSYKRITTDFFKTMQQESVRFDVSEELIKKLATVNCDVGVFNRELEMLNELDRSAQERALTKYLLVNARDGVYGSLTALKDYAEDELAKLTKFRMAISAIF